MHKLIFLFLLFTTLCRGQDLGTPNSQWVYDYNGGLGVGVTVVNYDRDTVVMGDTIKLFFRTLIRETSSGVVTSPRSQPIYIRDRDRVVEYSYNLVDFDTLYNFNAPIGSSWTLNERRFDGSFTGESFTRTVLNTFFSDFNGVNTFCQEIQSSNEIIVDTICSGIGSRVFYLDPFDHLDIPNDGGEGGVLRCFSNETYGVIEFRHPWEYYGGSFANFEYDCDQLTSLVSTPSQNIDFKIFPNPAGDMVFIQSPNVAVEHITIYNLQGGPVYTEAIEGGATSINTSSWTSGMYYVLINGQHFEKLVISR